MHGLFSHFQVCTGQVHDWLLYPGHWLHDWFCKEVFPCKIDELLVVMSLVDLATSLRAELGVHITVFRIRCLTPFDRIDDVGPRKVRGDDGITTQDADESACLGMQCQLQLIKVGKLWMLLQELVGQVHFRVLQPDLLVVIELDVKVVVPDVSAQMLAGVRPHVDNGVLPLEHFHEVEQCRDVNEVGGLLAPFLCEFVVQDEQREVRQSRQLILEGLLEVGRCPLLQVECSVEIPVLIQACNTRLDHSDAHPCRNRHEKSKSGPSSYM